MAGFSPRERLIVAGAIALVGVVVAMRAISRGESPPTAGGARAVDDLQRPDGKDLCRVEGPSGVSHFVSTVAARIISSDEGIPEQIGAPQQAASELATLVGNRLRSILTPETVDWQSVAREEGAASFAIPKGLSEQAVERFSSWRTVWADAEFAPALTTIRHLRLDDELAYSQQLRAVSLSSPLSASYELGDFTRVAEVLIPARIPRSAGSSQRIDVHLGIAYWWSASEQRWRPAMISVYTDGPSVVAPPM